AYRPSSCDKGRSSAMTYQIPDDALYCRNNPWLSRLSVPDADPPVLLNTSDPPHVTVTAFVPPWMTCFTATCVPSAGADGSVTVNPPLVVSHGTRSPAAAV